MICTDLYKDLTRNTLFDVWSAYTKLLFNML